MDGLVVIDKPVEWTSHDVVARVRRVLGERRVGHTGTLDPFATGVLVVLVGRATRLARFLAGANKEYEMVVRFGYSTDTGDATGTPRNSSAADVKRDCPSWSDAEIEAALHALRGEQQQVPPMYSAKKVKGQKLYELARRGVEVEREPVPITIYEFEILRGLSSSDDGDGNSKSSLPLLQRNTDGTCDLAARVICSAGTYVRTLAESLGERLGVAAHLAALRRTRAGEFCIEHGVTLDALAAMTEDEKTKTVLSPDAALSGMPFVHLTADAAKRARHGVAASCSHSLLQCSDGQYVGMCDEQGALFAVGVYAAATNQVHPRVLLSSEE